MTLAGQIHAGPRWAGRWEALTGDRIAALGLSIIVGSIALRFAPLGVDEHHDGMMFKVARDILHGAIPFRETFSQYGLLLSLIHALALAVLGETVFSIKLATVAAYALTAGILYLAWSRLATSLRVGAWVAALSVVLWIAIAPFYLMTFLPWSSAMVLPAQAALLVVVQQISERANPGRLVLVGALIGCAFWIRMPVGLLSFITLVCFISVVAIARDRRAGVLVAIRQLIWLATGLAAVSLPLLAWLAWHRALHDWFLQTFMMAIYFARTIPHVWSGSEGGLASLLENLFPARINAVWAILPAATGVATVWASLRILIRRVDANDARLCGVMAVGALCLASWSQYHPVTEERHVFWGATPMVGYVLVCAAAAANGLADRCPCAQRPVFRIALMTAGIGVISFLFGPPIAQRYEASHQRLAEHAVRPIEPLVLAGLALTPDEAALYATLDRDIRAAQWARPQARVITTGYDPLVLTFGTHRPNWHPLYVFFDIGVAVYPAYPTELAAFVARETPIIISSGGVWPAQAYAAHSHYANGLSLLLPGTDRTPHLLPQIADERAVVSSLRVPNRFNLRSPMRVTGHRLAALPPLQEATLEVVVRPELVEGAAATLFTNLHGPSPGRGLRLHKTSDAFRYALTIGTATGLRRILTFTMRPRACNHIAIRWSGEQWSVWRDGLMVDEARVLDAAVDSANQVIVNNGMARLEYHVGLIDEFRVVAKALDADDLVTHARAVAQACASHPTAH